MFELREDDATAVTWSELKLQEVVGNLQVDPRNVPEHKGHLLTVDGSFQRVDKGDGVRQRDAVE